MEEAEAFLAQHPEVRFLDVFMYDLNGIIRGKRVDISMIKKLYKSGFPIPSSNVFLDVTGENTNPDGRGDQDGDPDGLLKPIPGTLSKVPWLEDDIAQVLTTMTDEDGVLSFEDPRNVLIHVMEQVKAQGLNPVVACELEFYLMDMERAPDGGPIAPTMPKSGRKPTGYQVYSMDEIDQFSDFFRDVVEACDVQGIPAGPASAEYSAGQFEINLNHVDDAVSACDHSALLQRVIRGVAIKHGFEATFMAKPTLEGSGNGLHIHCSMLDNDGNNIFDNDGGAQGTDELRYAIGGMLETMHEGMAIFAPNINAFRRFAPGSYVPTCRAWSYNNRSTALRVPGGDAIARRFEHRIAGADANPYLVMAVMLAGALHGIKNKIEPPEFSTGDATLHTDSTIPSSMQQGLDCLGQAKVLPGIMGELYLSRYAQVKQFEYDRFLRETISSKEYEWYMLSR
ncbi:MAG: glutamine synthetase [Rhodospirillales bacterium]|jgi:glutamine synthetase|nr:glutamine synthetase [Rhodospirillales bacterium]